MKTKKTLLIIVSIVTIGAVSIATGWRLYQTRKEFQAPLQPKATSPQCTVEFTVPSPTPTNTGTPGPTNTLTPTPTVTPTGAPTQTPTTTQTPTPTPTGTRAPTPTPTPTNTPSPTSTIAPTATKTPTSTPLPTSTPVLVCGSNCGEDIAGNCPEDHSCNNNKCVLNLCLEEGIVCNKSLCNVIPTLAPTNTQGPTPTRIILPSAGVDFPIKALGIVGVIITLLGFLILL